MANRWGRIAMPLVSAAIVAAFSLVIRAPSESSAAPVATSTDADLGKVVSLAGPATQAVPTPGPGAMTVYAVTNSQATALSVQHVFKNTSGFSYSFFDQIAPMSTTTYHISTMSQVPSPFNGTLNLYASLPFTAQVVGYDYPGSVTPTGSPSATATAPTNPTNTPTGVKTPAATNTATASHPPATPSPTPTLPSTPTSTPTLAPSASATATASTTLFSDGFEESSFSAGGWSLDVAGTGSSAQLVSSPVWAGAQAASFSTQSQSQGQHAFANASFTWPGSNVAMAQAMVQLQVSSLQGPSQILGLETRGVNPWTTRAGFVLEADSNFGVVYTTLDGIVHYADTGHPFQSGQWYNLAVTVDDRTSTPVFTFFANGQVISTLTDTTTGSDTDQPTVIDVGFGPGWWGNNVGTVTADSVAVTSGTAKSSTPTSTATATATNSPIPTVTNTPTQTNTPVRTATATNSPTSTPRPTSVPTLTATATATASTVLFSDGFEESSFATGGWSLNVVGLASTAQLVTNPVWTGAQAAKFGTLTQALGQQAFANGPFAWPTSNVVSAQTMFQLGSTTTQGVPFIFGLNGSDGTKRAGFLLSPSSTFGVIYTTRDGAPHLLDLGIPYQIGTWYNLAVTVDYRGTNPTFTFFVGGSNVYSVSDGTGGSSTAPPTVVVVGYGATISSTNAPTAVYDDNVLVTSTSSPPAPPTQGALAGDTDSAGSVLPTDDH